MRILQIVQTHPPEFSGGSVIYGLELSAALREKGHTVDILAGTYSSHLPYYEWNRETLLSYEFFRVKVPRTTRNRKKHTRKIAQIMSLILNESSYDLVHFHSAVNIGEGVLEACYRRKIPVIVTAHDYWWFCPVLHYAKRFGIPNCSGASFLKCVTCSTADQVQSFFTIPRVMARSIKLVHWINKNRKRTLGYSAGLVQLSSYGADAYRTVRGMPKTRMCIIPTAVRHEISKKQPNMPPKTIRFGALGALRHGKGGKILIAAAKKLHRSGRNSD